MSHESWIDVQIERALEAGEDAHLAEQWATALANADWLREQIEQDNLTEPERLQVREWLNASIPKMEALLEEARR